MTLQRGLSIVGRLMVGLLLTVALFYVTHFDWHSPKNAWLRPFTFPLLGLNALFLALLIESFLQAGQCPREVLDYNAALIFVPGLSCSLPNPWSLTTHVGIEFGPPLRLRRPSEPKLGLSPPEPQPEHAKHFPTTRPPPPPSEPHPKHRPTRPPPAENAASSSHPRLRTGRPPTPAGHDLRPGVTPRAAATVPDAASRPRSARVCHRRRRRSSRCPEASEAIP